MKSLVALSIKSYESQQNKVNKSRGIKSSKSLNAKPLKENGSAVGLL